MLSRKRAVGRRVLFSLVFAGALWSAPLALAQEARGNIAGTVRDQTGGLVPSADIEVRNSDTNDVTNVRTNESGAYAVPFLKPGRYVVAAAKEGFKRALRENVELHVGDRLQINLVLEVGVPGETIVVAAEAELLETGTASKGQVIDGAKVRDLPNLGRNPFLLATLATGVDTYALRGKGSAAFRPFDGPAAQMTVGGVYGRYEILLDGVPNAPSERGTPIYTGFVPSPDAVEEFKVQTNVYDAQYGRTSGTVVNMVLRGGTNDLHGTAFYYHRDPAWSANTFESNAAGKAKAELSYKQPGLVLSGPVILPSLYNGRDRTFFMASWEHIANSNPSPFRGTVPTEAMRKGDFSQLLTGDGKQIVIYDPLSTRKVGNDYVRDAFPGNQIPAGRIDPVAAKIMSYFPLPNTTPDATGANNYVVSPNSTTDTYNSYILRLDHMFSPKHKLSGRFARNVRDQQYADNGFPKVASSGGSSGYHHWRNNIGASFEMTDVLSPSLFLGTRYGWIRHTFGLQQPGDPFDPTELGFPSSLVSQLARGTFPGVSLSGYSGIGTAASQYNATDTHTLSSTLHKSLGSHSFKTGIEFRYMFNNFQVPASSFGGFNFDRGFTQRDPLRGDPTSGNSIASFLLGYPQGGSVPYNIAQAYEYSYAGIFVHDDWRVSSKLTLNLGLRWDYESPLSERYDRQNRGFDANAASPLQVPGMQLKGGLLFTDSSHRLPFKRDLDNFQPRLGAVYRLGEKAVVRGGVGISYLPTFDTGQNNGFSITTSYIASNPDLKPANKLGNPYPTGILQPVGRSLGLATLLGQGFTYSNPDRTIPKSLQFSLSLQRELPWRAMIDVAYIGSRVSEWPVTKNINALPAQYFSMGNDLLTAVTNPMAGLLPGSGYNGPTVQRQQLLRPYMQFGNINEAFRPVGKISYDSLQVSLEKRLSHGIHLRASYTWNKVMTQTGYLNDQDPIDSPVRAQSFDPSQMLTLAGGYALPFFANDKGVLGQVFGGWQLDAVVRKSNGSLVAPPDGFELVGSPNLPTGEQSYDRLFKTCTQYVNGSRANCASASDPVVFMQRASWTLRTWHTNTPMPGVRARVPLNVDLALSKSFPIRNSLRLQIRAEAYNLTNTPLFTGINWNNPNSTLFGSYNRTQSNDPRIIQLAAKLMF